MTPLQWGAFVAIVVLFVYGEGWRALVLKWSPFVVRRLHEIDGSTGAATKVLAPLYALGLIGADRSLFLRAWGGSVAIVVAVIAVRATPHPWRGMIDVGVSLALALGLFAVAARFLTPASPTRD